MTPTPPNAGEPVAYRMILRDGTRVLGWMSTEGLSEKDMVSVREVMEGLGGHVEYAYSHPQPNAGVVTDVELPPLPPVSGYDRRTEGHYSPQAMRDYALTAIHAALSAAPKPECTIIRSEDPSAPAYLALGAVKVTRERCE